MAPKPPPPLPVADNYASLTNRISLSIASRSSILKTMNHNNSVPAKRRVIPDDNDEDLTHGTQPNTGVGYVPEKKDVQKHANSKEERFLRGRLGKSATGKAKKKIEESESEEEVGRSALGKRKRSRKEVAGPEHEPKNQALPTTTGERKDNNTGEAQAEADIEMKNGITKEESTSLEGVTTKKRKAKNKKKQKTENAKIEEPV
ncbi:hypothetical protein NW768_009063 [Fusarium equiseti]|uniref:Uncharacterized protein n=1 Tax=Fusarium equiseti TaxID=61235 RepID=A0ABQ8R3X9_FUSEQ|nr:hypothetical protein NW768_009063 [Fusarium equiseti]